MGLALDKYDVKLTFTRDVLATNPCDPNVMDTHILDRQRKLITEKGGVNSPLNKYLDQIQISKDKGEAELTKLLDKLETVIGYKLSESDRQDAIAGKLESLRETLVELDVKGTTVFFWDKEKNLPCIGDHMIYGFLKAAGEAISRTLEKKNGTILHSSSYTSSLINQHVRCEKQFITFDKDIARNEDGTPFYLQRSLRAMTAQGPRISLAKSEVVRAGAKIQFKLNVMAGSQVSKDALNMLFEYGQISGLAQWRNAGYGQFTHELMQVG
jgi:hypothetical protein